MTAENEPSLDLRTNVSQSVDLLELCVEAGISRFYYASSGGAIYGTQDIDFFREDDRVLPVSPYGIGKLTIENYLRYFRVKHGLQSYALRISNPYGTGQSVEKRQGLIPIVLHQVHTGAEISRLGNGSMVRDYVYVNDLIEMILALVASEPKHDTYNLGSGHGTTVNEVFDSIRRITEVNFSTRDLPKPATFVDTVVLDTSRFTDEFGYPSITTLDQGVAAVWSDIRLS
ncbi:hypothetical protein GCM10009563_23550 [Subtercola frigoramans]